MFVDSYCISPLRPCLDKGNLHPIWFRHIQFCSKQCSKMDGILSIFLHAYCPCPGLCYAIRRWAALAWEVLCDSGWSRNLGKWDPKRRSQTSFKDGMVWYLLKLMGWQKVHSLNRDALQIPFHRQQLWSLQGNQNQNLTFEDICLQQASQAKITKITKLAYLCCSWWKVPSFSIGLPFYWTQGL